MKSALICRLERSVVLTAEERDWIARLEREERPVAARTTLYAEGEPMADGHVLRYGWAIVRGRCVNGRAPILRIYLPGEIIGLAELGRAEAVHSIQMQTDGSVSTFPRVLFAELIADAPRLAALLVSLSSLDQIVLREWLGALTRMDGASRLIHFLLQMRDRLAPLSDHKSARFELPFSQAEIADILGVTTVYVNRMFQTLRKEGRLENHGRSVRLLDVAGMERDVGYRDVQQGLYTDWFT